MRRELFTRRDPNADLPAPEPGADAGQARDWARDRFPVLLEARVCRRDRAAHDEIGRWFLAGAPRWARAYVAPGSAGEDAQDVAAEAVVGGLKGLDRLWAEHGRQADGEAYLSRLSAWGGTVLGII